MDLEILGDTLRFIRLNSTKLSQEDLADKVGLERTYISKIESGKKNVTVETLGSICEGLGITVTYFFNMYEQRLKTKKNGGNKQ